MTQEEKFSRNRVIANSDFAGENTTANIEHYKDSGNDIGLKEYYSGLKFHSSWDELIPVVKAIRKISHKEEIHFVCVAIYNNIESALIELDIELVFNSVVIFIKRYNADKFFKSV